MIEQHYRNNYEPLVSRLCRRLSKPDAEEIVQQAYCNTLDYLSRNDTELNIDRWLNIVINNLFISHLRRERHRGATHDDHIAVTSFQIHDIYALLTLQEIREEIEKRNERDQYILSMILSEGIPYSDVCTILGITQNVAWKVVHRFKMEMRDKYHGV